MPFKTVGLHDPEEKPDTPADPVSEPDNGNNQDDASDGTDEGKGITPDEGEGDKPDEDDSDGDDEDEGWWDWVTGKVGHIWDKITGNS